MYGWKKSYISTSMYECMDLIKWRACFCVYDNITNDITKLGNLIYISDLIIFKLIKFINKYYYNIKNISRFI